MSFLPAKPTKRFGIFWWVLSAVDVVTTVLREEEVEWVGFDARDRFNALLVETKAAGFCLRFTPDSSCQRD